MSFDTVSLLIVRCALALAIGIAAVPLASPAVSAAEPASSRAKPGDPGSDSTYSEEQIKARAAARDRAAAEAAANPPPPPKPAPVKIAKPVVAPDPIVPGCGPASLCTVCVAGCLGGARGIVHRAPKRANLVE